MKNHLLFPKMATFLFVSISIATILCLCQLGVMSRSVYVLEESAKEGFIISFAMEVFVNHANLANMFVFYVVFFLSD